MPAASLWSSAPPGDLGSTDYAALFAPNNQWPQVAAHTGTFGLYAGWVLAAGDPVLARRLATTALAEVSRYSLPVIVDQIEAYLKDTIAHWQPTPLPSYHAA